MATNLQLERRIQEGALTGFDLNNALGEAVGYASMCWDTVPTGAFDSEAASALVGELRNAILAAARRAINYQGIDALANTTDWELTELIGQSPAFGFDKETN